MFESHAEIVRLSMAGTWICLGLVALLTNLAYRNKKVLLALLTSVLIGAGVVAGYLGSSLITTDSIKVIMAFMLAACAVTLVLAILRANVTSIMLASVSAMILVNGVYLFGGFTNVMIAANIEAIAAARLVTLHGNH